MTSANAPDVIVIGGGPAGATCSTLLAQRGFRVQLFEREHFPRFHIGESLIPETYWVLERLKMLDKMRHSAFVKKFSVQFVTDVGKVSAPFFFDEHKPHECSQTWQVLRSEFDQMMLENAREQGVEAHEGVRVLEVLFENQRAVGVKISRENGPEEEVRAPVIVDASGQSTMLVSRLQLREWDKDLRKAALWTYWENAERDPGKNGGATLVIQSFERRGWFWYIPLHNHITSIGIVADYTYLFQNRSQSEFEEIYNFEVENCPGLKARLTQAQRIAPFRVLKEYSYRARQGSGDGWVTIGDAYGFLDPLYSSGVLLALKSGQLAADAIAEALPTGDTSGARLGAWLPGFNRGMDRMRRLVCEYYDGLSFGRFIRKHPDQKGFITDLLIGDIFDEKVDPVFKNIDALKAEIAAEKL